jgi:hypothetical protein
VASPLFPRVLPPADGCGRGQLEPDWDTTVIDHPDPALTRRILDTRSARLASPRVGRQLVRLLSGAGLTGLTVLPMTIVSLGMADAARRMLEGLPVAVDQAAAEGRITRRQADRWFAGVAEAAESGSFFAATTSFLVGGTKPG